MPHTDAPLLTAGVPLASATHALVLAHGRGASADGMLDLAEVLLAGAPGRWAVLAPQADGGTWYPFSFMVPMFDNEPELSGALACFGRAVDAARAAGLADARLVLGGFSQGACLAQEWAVRHAARFGALLGFSGGLIGPPGTRWDRYAGTLGGTPALVAVHDNDPHIPLVRTEETARVLTEKGADVDVRLYRGTAHTIMPDSVRAAQALIAAAGSGAD